MENQNNEFRNWVAGFVGGPALWFLLSDEGKRALGNYWRWFSVAMVLVTICWLVYPYVRDNTQEARSRMTKAAWAKITRLWGEGAWREIAAFVKPFAVLILGVVFVAALAVYGTYSVLQGDSQSPSVTPQSAPVNSIAALADERYASAIAIAKLNAANAVLVEDLDAMRRRAEAADDQADTSRKWQAAARGSSPSVRRDMLVPFLAALTFDSGPERPAVPAIVRSLKGELLLGIPISTGHLFATFLLPGSEPPGSKIHSITGCLVYVSRVIRFTDAGSDNR